MPSGEEARQRHASLLALLEIGREVEEADAGAGLDDFLAEVERRIAAESEGAPGSGVELLTFHRAKGLEWDAVFLPALEEGILPIRQATEPAEIEEERRLLYVGLTRARVHVWLSSARHRDGRSTDRRRSRFLLEIAGAARPAGAPGAGRRGEALGRPHVAVGPGLRRGGTAETEATFGTAATLGADEAPGLFEALRAWRLERARADAVPPYVIFHDRTLTAVAERRPRDLADLATIPGIGPAKLDRYGASSSRSWPRRRRPADRRPSAGRRHGSAGRRCAAASGAGAGPARRPSRGLQAQGRRARVTVAGCRRARFDRLRRAPAP